MIGSFASRVVEGAFPRVAPIFVSLHTIILKFIWVEL